MKDKYCSLVRATLPALFITAALILNTSVRAQAPPGSLWYNGDFNGVGFHANGVNTSDPPSKVYGEFNVTGGPAWHVTALFSNNLLSTVVTGANWEIRQGERFGTLIPSGLNAPAVVTPTGRSGFGLTEFMVEVAGLNFFLPPLLGQHYWINVEPIGNGTGRSLNTTTTGTNCVGTPCGNGMSYLLPEGTFTSTNFSMGVIGTVVPEPATWALLGIGLSALLTAARWRRSHSGEN